MDRSELKHLRLVEEQLVLAFTFLDMPTEDLAEEKRKRVLMARQCAQRAHALLVGFVALTEAAVIHTQIAEQSVQQVAAEKQDAQPFGFAAAVNGRR